jgi:sulfotransferase family protein
MKSIVWLASYPKSGNTWLRVFLANYIYNAEKPVPINQIHRIGLGDSNSKAYRAVTREAFDPTNVKQSLRIRPDVLKSITNNQADINLVKTHCENGIAFGSVLIPPELTRSAIYIMRNPLDMIVSYASHYGNTMDGAIEGIGRKDNSLLGGGDTVYQFLGNWSNHVIGWTKARKFPVLALRYEDMLKDPLDAFERVVHHIGLPYDRERLERSVRFSDFKILQEQESTTGFVENSDNQEKFFRSGKADQWKTELTDEQISQIIRDHGRVMKKFGYET